MVRRRIVARAAGPGRFLIVRRSSAPGWWRVARLDALGRPRTVDPRHHATYRAAMAAAYRLDRLARD